MKKIHGAGLSAAAGKDSSRTVRKRKKGFEKRICCILMAGVCLSGCAGPSTRVIVRSETGNIHEIPDEIPVLEEVNPFYLQETLSVLSETPRYGGSRGERDAVKYMEQLLTDYGYQVEIQRFRYETDSGIKIGTNIEAVRESSSRDSDILLICAAHDTEKDSPGANDNGSGSAALLEMARLLSRIPSDTELRFVSFAQCGGERLGVRHYVESLGKREKERLVGAIELNKIGHVSDDGLVLGTTDGKSVYVGDLLRSASREVTGDAWPYVQKTDGNIGAFVRDEIPAVIVSQKWPGYENGTPLDLAETVDAEELAQCVDVVCRMALEMMSTDTPSMMAKAHSYHDLDYSFVQTKDTPGWFSQTPEFVQNEIGRTGVLEKSYEDSEGHTIEKYQFRMKWFQVDQIILTDYYFSDGKLKLISLEGAEAGVDWTDMTERLTDMYGAPEEGESGPDGSEYYWTDPVYGKLFSMIPKRDGYELEIREYEPERMMYEQRKGDGTILSKEKAEDRCRVLSDLVWDIFPENPEKYITMVNFYTDGINHTAGWAEKNEKQKSDITEEAESSQSGWQIFLDVEDALDAEGNWKNKTDTVLLLTGLCGEIFESLPVPGAAEEKLGTFGERYKELFETQNTGEFPEAKDQPEPPQIQIGTEPGKKEEEPAPPDFVTAFQMYVLAEPSDDISENWLERLKFFEQFEECIAYRKRVRANLNMTWEVSYDQEN